MAKRIVEFSDIIIKKEKPLIVIKKSYSEVDNDINKLMNIYTNKFIGKINHNILITSVVNKRENHHLVNFALCTTKVPDYRLDVSNSYMEIENCVVTKVTYFITKDKQILKMIPENFDKKVALTFDDMVELANYLNINNHENRNFKVLFWDEELSLKLYDIGDDKLRTYEVLKYMKELGYSEEYLEIHHKLHEGSGHLLSYVYVKFGEEFINKEIMLEMAKCPSNPKIVGEKLDEFFLGLSKKDNLVEDLNNELLTESVEKDVKNLFKSFPELE